MLNYLKKRILTIMVVLIGIVCIGSNAVCAEKIMRISHQWPKAPDLNSGDYRDRLVQIFAKKVQERTKGEFKFEIYPGATLFSPKAQYDGLLKGGLEFALYPLTYGTGRVPEWDITMMPGFPKDHIVGEKWRYSPIGKALEKLCEDNGIKILTYIWNRGGIGTKIRPVKRPEDAKGLKFRATGKSFELMLNKGCGAAITSMPSTEIYFALQTGVLDGALTGNETFETLRLYEQIQYYTTTKKVGIFNCGTPLVISMQTWKKLTPEQRNIVVEVGLEMDKYAVEQGMKADDSSTELLRSKGVKMYDMTIDDYNAWIEVAKKTAWKDFVTQYKQGKELIDMALSVK